MDLLSKVGWRNIPIPLVDPMVRRRDIQSAAIKRRSRCGSVRGRPVLSSHFSPGAAPHVGHRTACIFLRVLFLAFISADDAAICGTRMVNFAQETPIVVAKSRLHSVENPLLDLDSSGGRNFG
jgi:hypothetical protein